MKLDEISIDVKAGIKVDKKTAETCLKLVELYCDRTKSYIQAERDSDGTVFFKFARSEA